MKNATYILSLLLALMNSRLIGQTAHQEPAEKMTLSPEILSASDLSGRYRVTPNITYSSPNGYSAKLDVYASTDHGRKATLIYIHGGGWRGGPTKEEYSLWFEPFLFAGWNVINVEYRPSTVAPAPAAVEDCLCALRWVSRNADRYEIDKNRIVVMGHSAGGHLALMTGMTPASAGFGKECPDAEPIRVAAIVDWFGITDVADLLQGADMRTFAVNWIGNSPGQLTRARSVSPLTYVRPGLPATIIIHGDKDPKVPYTQAVRLHDALTAAGDINEFVTIPGGGHGGFGSEQTRKAYAQIFDFLQRNGVGVESTR
jgi:acetyl esterase/lipase